MPELDVLAAPLRGAVAEFAARVVALAGENLLSVLVHGPVVAGGAEFDPERDVVRTAVVLREVDLEFLRALAVDGASFGKRRVAAPILLTPDAIESSRDTFPLELLEIHQFHRVVVGSDPLASLDLEPADVRRQCERELKTVAIGLRQGLLASAGDERWLGALEDGVVAELLRTLRGLVWMRGEREPIPAADVVTLASTLYGVELPGLARAISDRFRRGWHAFVELYRDVEALGRICNE